MTRRGTFLFGLSLLLSLPIGSPAAKAACEPMTIYAAASTTEAVKEIAAEFGIEEACAVTTVFAGSSTLARQIDQGAPAQLFLSANERWMDWLEARGHIVPQNRASLLTNKLVLIVPKKDNLVPLYLNDPGSLKKLIGDGKLALANPDAVPAGIYTKEALQSLGHWGDVHQQIVTADSVRVALAWVERGEAAAAAVYRTDALISDKVSVAAEFPDTSYSPIAYPLAMLGRAPHPDTERFFAYLKSYEAAEIFAKYGFSRIEDVKEAVR